MHIGFDARLVAYREAGTAHYVRLLLHALIKLDRTNTYTIFVARGGEPVLDTSERGDQVEHHTLLTPPHHRLERAALSLELAPCRLDLLHSPDFIPPHLRRGTRSVITVHDLAFLRYPDLLDGASQRYYGQIEDAVQRADAIIAPSQSTRRDLLALTSAPAEKIHVVYEAANERFRPLDRLERLAALRAPDRLPPDMARLVSGEFGPFILFVGTIEPRKNLLLLFQAYERYRERAGRRAATRVLFGAPGWRAEAELAEIERLRRESKLVWFRGGTDDQLLLLYNAASLLVLPSHYEGFGLPAIEAMACGTPVLASNCSSLPEVTGAAGVLLPPDDAEAWADALRENSENRAKRDELIAASLKQAAQFSWLRAAEQTLAVYRRALGQEEPAAPADMVESWRR
ncbi:MAG: glycosyltransferase family 4 protein [Thermomicrobiales bacterium]